MQYCEIADSGTPLHTTATAIKEIKPSQITFKYRLQFISVFSLFACSLVAWKRGSVCEISDQSKEK